MHPRVLEVTERLVERSRKTRERYLAMMVAAASEGPQRGGLQCANFAHGVAGCKSTQDKQSLRLMTEELGYAVGCDPESLTETLTQACLERELVTA